MLCIAGNSASDISERQLTVYLDGRKTSTKRILEMLQVWDVIDNLGS